MYTDKRDMMIGYIEAATGIGLIMGPVIGSSLYQFGGYSFTFYTFGVIFICFSFTIRILFNAEIDSINERVTGLEEELNSGSLERN
jgi:MFS family permease